MCDAIVISYHYNPIQIITIIPYTVSLIFLMICSLVPAYIILNSAMVCMRNPYYLPSLCHISFFPRESHHGPCHTIDNPAARNIHLTLRVLYVYSVNFSQAHLTLDVVSASTPSFEFGTLRLHRWLNRSTVLHIYPTTSWSSSNASAGGTSP